MLVELHGVFCDHTILVHNPDPSNINNLHGQSFSYDLEVYTMNDIENVWNTSELVVWDDSLKSTVRDESCSSPILYSSMVTLCA